MKKVMVSLMVLALLGMTVRIAFPAGKTPQRQATQHAAAVTLTGTVTHLMQPHAADSYIYFSLATRDGVKNIFLGPVRQLTDIGFTLANGDRVMVTGLPMAEPNTFIVRDMTVHNATYSLRTSETLPSTAGMR